MNNFFLKRINFEVRNELGQLEIGLFYDDIFEFENKLFNLQEYGKLENSKDVETLIENLELLYKHKILWNTIKRY